MTGADAVSTIRVFCMTCPERRDRAYVRAGDVHRAFYCQSPDCTHADDVQGQLIDDVLAAWFGHHTTEERG